MKTANISVFLLNMTYFKQIVQFMTTRVCTHSILYPSSYRDTVFM